MKSTYNFYKKYLLFLIVILNLFSSCLNQNELTIEEKNYLKNNPELKVALYPYYPPYQYTNEKGEIVGVIIDFMNLIEKKNNIKFKKINYTNWDDAIKDAKNNKIDLILEIQETNERKDYLNFFNPFFESQIVIVQRKGTVKIDGLENIGNRVLVLPKNYGSVETAKNINPNVIISYEKNDIDCLKKLNEGKFDAFIGPRAVVYYFTKKENLTNLEITGNLNEKYAPSFATLKSNKLFSSIIKKNINSITSSEKKEIMNNWLFNPVVPFYEKPYFWILISCSILGILIVFTILNSYLKKEVDKRTNELNKAKELAEESNKFKTNFIQNISHEIKTPMNAIIGFSELLKNETLQKEEQIKYLNIISNATKELEKDINSIIDIAELETSELTINNEFFYIENLIDEIYTEFLPRTKEKKIEFTLNKINEKNALKIFSDRKKIYKVLSYLIDNAIKFTPSGCIKINSEVKQNYLKISIEDSGVGILDTEKDSVFLSFFQSEKTLNKNYGGLGLGLYFAKKITNKLNGDLTFSSSHHSGSKFDIIFTKIETTNNSNVEKELVSKIKKNNYNILIAEDVEVNYLLLQKLLLNNTKFEFKITRAKDGKEAIEIFKENNFDLIFMDIKMPNIDGYEATRIIKNLNQNTIIVAQTAFSQEEDVKKAFDSGCNDLLSKPINNKNLSLVLEKYFDF